MSSLTLTRGDSRDLALVAGMDLSGCKVWFTAKYRRTDDDDDAVFAKTSDDDDQIDVTSAVGGLATVHILAADWAAYTYNAGLVWDVQVRKTDGTVITPLSGGMAVISDVTLDDSA